MKQTQKQKLISLIAGGTLLSIGGCSSDEIVLPSPSDDFSSQNFAKDAEDYQNPYEISTYLSAQKEQGIKNLSELARDMYLNEALASEFKNDPNSVFHRYGFNSAPFGPETSPGICLMSLANEQAVGYLQNGYFQDYVQYLSSKGVSLREDSTILPFLDILNSGNNKNGNNQEDAAFFPIVAFVAAIYAVAATVAAVEVVTVVHFAVKISFAGAAQSTQENRERDLESTQSTIVAPRHMDLSEQATTDFINRVSSSLIQEGCVEEKDKEQVEQELRSIINSTILEQK